MPAAFPPAFRSTLAGTALATLLAALPSASTVAAMPGTAGAPGPRTAQDIIAAAITSYAQDPVERALQAMIGAKMAEIHPPQLPDTPGEADAGSAAPPAAPGAAPAAGEAAATVAETATPAAEATPPPVAIPPRARPLSRSELDWKGIAAFYGTRNYAPVFFTGGAANARARAIATRLAAADGDGLNPADYSGLDLSQGRLSPEQADRIAHAELRMAMSVLRYARDAQVGLVNPASLSPLVAENPQAPEPAAVLATVAGAADPVAAIDSFNPPYAGFHKLRQKLADLRAGRAVAVVAPAGTGSGTPSVGGGPVMAVRDAGGWAVGGEAVGRFASAAVASDVDPMVTGAVPRARPGGTVDVAAIDPVPAVRAPAAADRRLAQRKATEAAILANMERWRWLPRDPGAKHVWVDIPGYDLAIVRDGQQTFHTRVVVGKDTNQTPSLSSAINNIVVNPYWNVPVSIVSKEMLARIKANPAYLTRNNYEVLYRGQPMDPTRIVWNENAARALSIRQKPGGRNALGTVKFLFPNPFSVYLHDTPSKSKFANDDRADSHGCVRVQNPMAFAAALLEGEPNLSGEKVEQLVGGKERWLKVADPVPVHLTYFTATVDAGGRLVLREDIYGRDPKLKKKLGLGA